MYTIFITVNFFQTIFKIVKYLMNTYLYTFNHPYKFIYICIQNLIIYIFLKIRFHSDFKRFFLFYFFIFVNLNVSEYYTLNLDCIHIFKIKFFFFNFL